jgi:hypothetical protein
MADPDSFTSASSLKRCLKECEVAVKDCNHYVSFAVTCSKALALDRAKYEKTSCADTFSGSTEHDCKVTTAANKASDLMNVQIAGGNGLAGCAVWHDACVASCHAAKF